jgi:tetratricopeptide (TPR) repeat protein
MRYRSGLRAILNIMIALLSAMLIFTSGCSKPAYIVRNELLIANGDLDQAILDYKEVSQNDLENPEPYYYLARAYYLKKDYQKAGDEIDKAVLLEPQIDIYRLQAARIAYEQSDFFSATNHLINTLLLNDKNLDAYYLLAKTYLKTGNAEKALLQLETALALEPLFFEAHLLWCRIKFNAAMKQSSGGSVDKQTQNNENINESEERDLIPKEITEASKEELINLIVKLEEALIIKPGSEDGIVLLSELHTSVGNSLKAEHVLTEWLMSFDPDSIAVVKRLAELKYSTGDYDKALEYLDKLQFPNLQTRVLKLDLLHRLNPVRDTISEAEALFAEHPDSPGLLLLLGKWQAEKGALKKAERFLQLCIETDPEFAPCYFELSGVSNSQKDVFGSQWALMQAFKLAPFNREIRLEYAKRLIEIGKPGDAWTILSHSSLNQADAQVTFFKGLAAKDQKNYKLAEQLFTHTRRHGFSIEVETQLAEMSILQKDYQLAEQKIEKLEQTASHHLEVIFVKALLLEKTDRFEEIPDLLEPHLESFQGKGLVHLKLAEALLKMGQIKKALVILEQGLKKWPRHLELVQSYSLLLGLTNQYEKAIYLLEDMQTFQHHYNQLFFYRLKAFYYQSGKTQKFREQTNPTDF